MQWGEYKEQRDQGRRQARDTVIQGADKEDRDEETEGGPRERHRYICRDRVGMVWNGQWLGGIWVKESQTDRRNGAVAGSSG